VAAHSSQQAAKQSTKTFVSGYKERDFKAMLANSGAERITVFQKEYLKIAGRDAVSFVSEYSIQHFGTTDNVRQINVFSTRHDLIYTLTCRMLQENYKRHESDVWEFMSGFYIAP